ncbi:HypC/HybG/HupF family hydrogenase formation chaperone [Pelodictyon luteolum]|uniref:Hydrogenase expression/formation protein (HUPF/HYPC) n=1 Tax=Chlorobium luteolum (strain DSM 273 / BCRC 81028 / 2530) TaxID=319225 RepID=Q3B2W6_CHLL3|nr:HypC/HybG/HupF family hydrogenase formation chaperone [Pelodictyon luteolum]ABB24315.1 Hydrogenase expression/formation protein (HUPF/HYPC) [Pelodictyon luteolum DSM 273]
MCLAIPGKLIEIFDENSLRMGLVDVNGTTTRVCLEYLPDIRVGQYTIIHAGFALKIVDEEEAAESLRLWTELIDRGAFDIDGDPPSPLAM